MCKFGKAQNTYLLEGVIKIHTERVREERIEGDGASEREIEIGSVGINNKRGNE